MTTGDSIVTAGGFAPYSRARGNDAPQSAPMRLLIVSALLGGVLTATLFWFWQRDLVFAIVIAPIGASFATLLAGALLFALNSCSCARPIESRKDAGTLPAAPDAPP